MVAMLSLHGADPANNVFDGCQVCATKNRRARRRLPYADRTDVH